MPREVAINNNGKNSFLFLCKNQNQRIRLLIAYNGINSSFRISAEGIIKVEGLGRSKYGRNLVSIRNDMWTLIKVSFPLSREDCQKNALFCQKPIDQLGERDRYRRSNNAEPNLTCSLYQLKTECRYIFNDGVF